MRACVCVRVCVCVCVRVGRAAHVPLLIRIRIRIHIPGVLSRARIVERIVFYHARFDDARRDDDDDDDGFYRGGERRRRRRTSSEERRRRRDESLVVVVKVVTQKQAVLFGVSDDDHLCVLIRGPKLVGAEPFASSGGVWVHGTREGRETRRVVANGIFRGRIASEFNHRMVVR